MINELPAKNSSNLTPEQRRQAEAAILGLTVPTEQEFTPAEYEAMRTKLAQYDQNGMRNKEFDLNRPPQKRYIHQEYPKMLYHHDDRVSKVVQTKAQEDGLLKLGYVREPFEPTVAEFRPPVLDAQAQAEVARIEAELKRRKGLPTR